MAGGKRGRKIKLDRKGSGIHELEIYDDLIAILLIALSLILGLSLINPSSSGLFGKVVLSLISIIFGKGMYFVPFGLMALALIFLSGKYQELRSVISGLSLSFVSLLSFFTLSLSVNQFFNLVSMKESGGFIGAVTAYPCYFLFGATGAYIIITSLMLVGIIISANKPLRELFGIISGVVIPSRKDSLVIERPTLTQPVEFVNEITTPEEATLKTVKLHENHQAEEEILLSETARIRRKYTFPPADLLVESRGKIARSAKEFKAVLESTLREFSVPAKVIGIQEGPTVTTFELHLEPGTRVSRLSSLSEDIALALATPNIRILTPIPGKQAIGIEVPNIERELVTLKELISRPEWKQIKDPLLIAIGKDISGKPFYFSIKDMPHLLIAGTTGSGKSICINSLITSILYRATPEEVKFVLVDPKRVELSLYSDIPHLLTPVIVNPKQAATVLSYIAGEMERRYELLSLHRVRNIQTYNQKAISEGIEPLPYIVIIIDELNDLMLVAPSEVEDVVVRISQMARAIGIHLVVATQRPSTDVITGLIKSNITTRIAFSVGSQIDSRVILDTPGAEKLIGRGDMLFLTQSLLKPIRLQSPYISEAEVQSVTAFVKSQRPPEYNEEMLKYQHTSSREFGFEDELFDEAVETILNSGQASVSYLQRKLRIGYARAARLMDMLEERGIVSPQDGARPREVLISPEEWHQIRSE